MGVKDFAPPCRSVMLVKGGDDAVRAVGFNAIDPSTRSPALAGVLAQDSPRGCTKVSRICPWVSTLITVVKEGMVYRFPVDWRDACESKTAYD